MTSFMDLLISISKRFLYFATSVINSVYLKLSLFVLDFRLNVLRNRINRFNR